MRVSSNLEPDIDADINQSETNLETALQQVSTGLRVNAPSDDPADAAAMVQNQAETNNIDQYTANANAALGATQTADSVLTSVVSQLTQAVSLGTEGANGTETAASRQSITTQIQGILASVVSDANTTYQGVGVFSGTSTTATPFVADASSPNGYTYTGNDGVNTVQVGDTLSVQQNIPGDQVFTNASASVLGSLTQLATALQSGTSADIGTATANVSAALNYVSAQHVTYESSISQLNSQDTFLSQETVTLSTQATNLVGVDTATAAENLTQAESQNSAVLAAAAQVLPTTLLDYLKQ
jgi:flagellar hook-associated protein 3 FlgL